MKTKIMGLLFLSLVSIVQPMLSLTIDQIFLHSDLVCRGKFIKYETRNNPKLDIGKTWSWLKYSPLSDSAKTNFIDTVEAVFLVDKIYKGKLKNDTLRFISYVTRGWYFRTPESYERTYQDWGPFLNDKYGILFLQGTGEDVFKRFAESSNMCYKDIETLCSGLRKTYIDNKNDCNDDYLLQIIPSFFPEDSTFRESR